MILHRRPHRDLPRHAITTLAVVMLAAGCTNTGQADPDPLSTGTASPTPTLKSAPSTTPSATPDGPTADQALELVDEYRNVLLALPELQPDQAADHITARAESLTTDQGTARQRLLDQATTIRDAADADFVPIMRGTPHTVLLDEPSLSGDNWTTTACVATQGQFTDVTTGEPGELEPAESEYIEADVALAPNGDRWLLADYAVMEGDDDHAVCIPPETLHDIEGLWHSYVEAIKAWGERGTPPDELGELENLTTGDALEDLRQAAAGPIRDFGNEALHGHEVLSATPSTVKSQWCFAPARSSTPSSSGSAPRVIQEASWVQAERGWAISRIRATVETSPEAPEDHRCFAD